MAPHDDKFRNDATFQCLLSSQRELLNRLKSEKHSAQPPCHKMNVTAVPGPWDCATNESIGFETSRNDNFALSKRMSIGIGADELIMPGREFEPDPLAESLYCGVSKKEEKFSHCHSKKKRRRSTLVFLDYIFENGSEPHVLTQPAPKRSRNRVEYNDSDDDDYGIVMEDVYSDDESVFSDYLDVINNDPFSPEIDPREAKVMLVTFDEAMGRSQDSQQQIHDWDKKMGLKRSHSKTMRLSSRSRKQLRQFTQKDIMHLSALE